MITLPWASRPIMILGAAGMLGSDLVAALRRRLGNAGSSALAWYDKRALDITDAEGATCVCEQIQPGTIINCAAYTDVDGCESHGELATAVNGRAPGVLGELCRRFDAQLVHVSTDFVFDGRARTPYRIDDAVGPISAYGRSKWEGEVAIRASGCRHLIVRTSWLFGLHGRNFVEAILQKVHRGEALRVVNDQVGCPTWAVDLSKGVIRLLDVGAEGVVHFANHGWCSWHEFAEAIVATSGLQASVTPITSEELNRPAKRPLYSVLDLSQYERLTNQTPRHWREALAEYIVRRESPEGVAERKRP